MLDKDVKNFLSRNSKTGRSVNVYSCQPTQICRGFCYRFKRTKKQALAIERRCGFNPGANTGPITWKTQVAAYKRNEALIKRMAAEGRLEELAVRLVQRMHNKEERLRWCGTGDLFPELCELIAMYAAMGQRQSFGFSRRPEMLEYLTDLCKEMGVPIKRWPYFIGSVDESTPDATVQELATWTNELNGYPALALATWHTGDDLQDFLAKKRWSRHVRVIFGIHSSQKKTRTFHPRACPATEGVKITCVQCRRCYGSHEVNR